MSTTEIKDLVRAEVAKAIKEELVKHLKSSIKNGEAKKDINVLIKKAMEEFVKFLYVRRSVWQSEIK